MNRDQLIGVFKQQLGQLVGQLFIHIGVDDQHVRDTDGLYRLVHAVVHARGQFIRRKHRLHFLSVGNLFIGQADQANIARGSKVENRASGRANAPETGIDIAITNRVSGFVEVQALRSEIFIVDAVGF